MQLTEYDPKIGCLMSTWNIDESITDILKNPYVEGAYSPLEFYVDVKADPPKVKKRPTQETRIDKTTIAADGQEVVALSNLPKPCDVEVRWIMHKVEDGKFEWGTRLSGEYTIRVRAFPYADWEGTVTAV